MTSDLFNSFTKASYNYLRHKLYRNLPPAFRILSKYKNDRNTYHPKIKAVSTIWPLPHYSS